MSVSACPALRPLGREAWGPTNQESGARRGPTSPGRIRVALVPDEHRYCVPER